MNVAGLLVLNQQMAASLIFPPTFYSFSLMAKRTFISQWVQKGIYKINSAVLLQTVCTDEKGAREESPLDVTAQVSFTNTRTYQTK